MVICIEQLSYSMMFLDSTLCHVTRFSLFPKIGEGAERHMKNYGGLLSEYFWPSNYTIDEIMKCWPMVLTAGLKASCSYQSTSSYSILSRTTAWSLIAISQYPISWINSFSIKWRAGWSSEIYATNKALWISSRYLFFLFEYFWASAANPLMYFL